VLIMPTATATAPVAQRPKNGDKAPQPMRPFVAGTRRTDEPDYDQSRTMTTTSQDLTAYEISPQGFLAGIWIVVEGVTASNAATVVFADDAPFNVLESINFQDTNSQPIVGPMTGYDLYIVGKYGGYHFIDDAKSSPVYTTTPGVGAGLGGSFTFVLYLPVELVRREGIGSLPNKSGSAQFKLDLRIAGSTTVFDTAPTNQALVRVRCTLEGWQDPNQADIRGNPVAQDPPAVQTTQYWSRQTYTLTSGAVDQKLQSIDGMVRSLIFIARDESSLRSVGDTEFPDPFTLQWEKNLIVDSRARTLWRHWIATHWGYTGTPETAGTGASTGAGARDLGVYPLTWALDFGLKVGAETRMQYLPVSDATNLTFRGTIGGSGANLYTVLINKVYPVGGNPLALTGGR
jgi:hypothetical protein